MHFRALLEQYWRAECLWDWEGDGIMLIVITWSCIYGCNFQGFYSNTAGSRVKWAFITFYYSQIPRRLWRLEFFEILTCKRTQLFLEDLTRPFFACSQLEAGIETHYIAVELKLLYVAPHFQIFAQISRYLFSFCSCAENQEKSLGIHSLKSLRI